MSNKRLAPLVLALATILLIVIVPWLQIKTIFLLLLIIIYYITIIIFLKPAWGVFLLILIRPSLDIFTNDSIIVLGNFNLNFSSLLAVITLIFAFFVLIKNRDRLKNIPMLLPTILFLLIIIISGFFSLNKFTSFIEITRLISLFSLYFLAFIFIKTEADLNKLLKIIIISVLIPGALAFYQYFSQTGMSLPFEGIYNRIYGTFAHPNLFAYYLIIPIALLLYLFLTGHKKRVETLFLLFPLLILIILLTLTFTRGAWLAFIIIIFIIGLVKYRKLLLASFLILILLYLFITPIKNRVDNLIANPYSSITWRLGLWQDILSYAREKPILGQGTGTAKDFILAKRGPSFGSSDPHNDYLKISLENGLLGLLAYLFLIIVLLINIIKKYLITKQISHKVLILFIFAISIAFYIMSFADNILRNTALEWAYWGLLGAVLAIKDKEITSSFSIK